MLKQIIKWGSDGVEDKRLEDQIILVNQISLVFALLAAPYFFIFMILDSNIPSLMAIPTTLSYFASILFNKYRLYSLANFTIITATSLSIIYYSSALGKASGAYYIYFALLILPVTTFGNTSYKKVFFSACVPFGCLFFLALTDFNLFQSIQLTPFQAKIINLCAMLTTSSLIFFSTFFYHISRKKALISLERSKDTIDKTLSTLKDAYSELEVTQNKLQTEYQKAALTQQQFLPKEMPTIEEYKIEHFFKGAYGVSGDFYDYKQFGFLTKFVVADVMSKSLSAAFITAHLYSIFRTLVSVETSPAKVLTIINQAFVDGRHDYEKAAAFAFDLDSKTNTITYSNACIGVAYLISAGTITELDYCGFMTGGERTEVYEEKKIQMQEGDILLIASDGLEDIVLKDGNRFGNETLLELIEAYLKDRQSNGGLRDFIVSHIASIADLESILADDIVLLVVGRGV